MKRLMFGILVAFGLVSVSMGAWIPEKDEANYQKLKAEMAEYDVGRECKGGGSLDGWCNLKNVIAFFDEIRASDAQPVCGGSGCKKSNGDYERKMSALKVAVFKIREMPRFKNDSAIYFYVKRDNGWGEANLNNFLVPYRGESPFWKEVWREWGEVKSDLEIDGARRGYWKKLAE